MKLDEVENIRPKCLVCNKNSKHMIVETTYNAYICMDCGLKIYKTINEEYKL